MEASFDTNCMYFDGKGKRTLLHTNISVSSIIRIPRYALGPYCREHNIHEHVPYVDKANLGYLSLVSVHLSVPCDSLSKLTQIKEN